MTVPPLVIDACFEVLTELECYDLLASASIGRFAVSPSREGPLVVPVNYAVDGTGIVFRSGYGEKVRLALRRPASFQVDAFDHETRTGWSVLARGRAHEVAAKAVEHLPVDTWVPDGRRHWLRLDILSISGRRILRP